MDFLLGALTSFKNFFKSAVEETITKERISQAANDILKPIITRESSLSTIPQNALDNISSFGIGIPLAFSI